MYIIFWNTRKIIFGFSLYKFLYSVLLIKTKNLVVYIITLVKRWYQTRIFLISQWKAHVVGTHLNNSNLLPTVVSKIARWVANSVDPDESPHLRHLIWVYTVCSGLSDKINTIKYNIWKCHAQIGKIMIKSSAITNQLSITVTGLIINYLFTSD